MSRMKKYSKKERQENILKLLNIKGAISQNKITKLNNTTSKTTQRDLKELIEKNAIKKHKKGKHTWYELIEKNILNTLHKDIDLDVYFSSESENRKLKNGKYSFTILDDFSKEEFFYDQEEKIIKKLLFPLSRKIIKRTGREIKREFENIVIDLSWASSKIEGNTMTLLDTEILLKNGSVDGNYSQHEIIMVLNHKKAVDFILQDLDFFKNLNTNKIEKLHKIIVDELNVKTLLRQHPVAITGTKYKPLDIPMKIKEELNLFCDFVNQEKNVLKKVIFISTYIPYLQPFIDGNKRTARLLANAILMSYDYLPISYKGVTAKEYLKAMLVFYEQNNLRPFIKIFMKMSQYANENYFL